MSSLARYASAVEAEELVARTGRLTQFFGLVLESEGPDAFLGERCWIRSRGRAPDTPAEVVGIRDGRVLLMPYDEPRDVRAGSEVVATGQALDVPVGDALLGRVVDAFGNPLDGGPPIEAEARAPLFAEARNPLMRPRIDHVLETGVAAIDTLHTIGRGQRVGIFSGSGVGKSVLIGMIARHTQADVSVVAMIGERGREVLEFVEEILGDSLARSVVVVATSDQPALLRSRAALAATSIAEHFRDQGRHVVLTMDSITRFAMAQREIGLAVGEPPTARGYTPSVFSMLPRLLERGGSAPSGGTITAFYSVLVEGDDLADPVADNIRAILDGHIVLSRDRAHQGHFPAIDPLQSNSRLHHGLCSEEERATAAAVIDVLSTYEHHRDLVEIGAYRPGSNAALDRAIKLRPDIESGLRQQIGESVSRPDALGRLSGVLAPGGAAS